VVGLGGAVEGWAVSGRGHIKLYVESQGRKLVVIASKNPSGDPRADLNWKTQVRRAIQGD
jgi:hypothetical protein